MMLVIASRTGKYAPNLGGGGGKGDNNVPCSLPKRDSTCSFVQLHAQVVNTRITVNSTAVLVYVIHDSVKQQFTSQNTASI